MCEVSYWHSEQAAGSPVHKSRMMHLYFTAGKSADWSCDPSHDDGSQMDITDILTQTVDEGKTRLTGRAMKPTVIDL